MGVVESLVARLRLTFGQITNKGAPYLGNRHAAHARPGHRLGIRGDSFFNPALVVTHVGESEMDHFVDQYPVFFGGGDIGIVANADQDEAAVFGIGNTMAYAGAVAAADTHGEMGTGKAAVIVGDC